jgi:hypothetical protein
MSDVEPDRKTGWRSWLAPTGQPPAWGLVRYMVCGLVLGGAFGAALPEIRGALLAALAGIIVAAAGFGARLESHAASL